MKYFNIADDEEYLLKDSIDEWTDKISRWYTDRMNFKLALQLIYENNTVAMERYILSCGWNSQQEEPVDWMPLDIDRAPDNREVHIRFIEKVLQNEKAKDH